MLTLIDQTYGLSLAPFHPELLLPCDAIDVALPPSAEHLIRQYETCVAGRNNATNELTPAKKYGVVYTPPAIADQLITDALNAWCSDDQSIFSPSSILDPACGAGLFLVRALRKLLSAHGQEIPPLSRDKRIARALSRLYGVDRDPLAVQITKLCLLMVAREHSPTLTLSAQHLNIWCGDALLAPLDTGASADGTTAVPFAWRRDLPPAAHGGFDIIIGNPPYGLSRDERLSAEENRRLKADFQQFRSGKVNKYLLFMARALDLLDPKGCLSFIVPNAWLGIDGGAPLRHRLLQARSLQMIRHYGLKAFPGVGVETVSLLVNQGVSNEQITLYDVARGETASIEVRSCLGLLEGRIPLSWPAGADAFLAEIRSCSLALGSEESPFIPYIALQAYATGKGTPPQTKEVVAQRCYDSDTPGPDTLPYLDGKDVGRFSYTWRGKHLRFGSFLAEHPPRERYTGPRILVREILGTSPHIFQATVIEEAMLYNRSILHILLKPGALAMHAYALAAVLNSPIASALLLLCGRKSQRSLFPKIVNDDLKSFLLPRALISHTSAPTLSTLAAIGRSWSESPPRTDDEISLREEELESAVADAYHLSATSRSFVVQLLGKDGRPKPPAAA